MSAAGGHVDAVRLLLNNNATPTHLNSYKKSALDMALEYDQVEVAVAMMQHKRLVLPVTYKLWKALIKNILAVMITQLKWLSVSCNNFLFCLHAGPFLW